MTNLSRRFSPAPVITPVLAPALVLLFAAAFVLAGLTIGTASASAHDSLVSSSPASDSNVSTPLTEVVLSFTEQPNAEFPDSIAIHVTDAAGSRIDRGAVVVGDRKLTVGVAPTTDGMYRVIWQSLSVDGHAISGQFDFSFTGATQPSETPSGLPSAPASTGVQATPAPSATSTGGAFGADASDSVTRANGSLALTLGIGILVIIIAAAAVVLLTRRKRSKTPAE